ncbi:hypothetical protein [Tardiphaga robiniae]|uniref:hypothetical protein n=1 Tax=Tardiphaga robiniae TaxID=943830 RepID=UPI00178CFDA2|nr:hypothetical protein [Tardiphaga robiniae]
MIKPLRVAVWLRHSCIAVMLCSAAIASSPSVAQDAAARSQKPASDSRINLDPRTNGANLVHGNYCGLGSRPGKSPIDALDVACMHHDACTPPSGIPDCDCNIQLREEAAAVASDPKQPSDLQIMASMIASAASVMICKPIINRAAAPPTPARPRNVPPADIPTANVPAADVSAASTPTANVPTTAPAPATPVSIMPPAVAPAAAAPEAATAAPMDIAPVAVAPVTEAPANGAPVNDAPASSGPLPIAPAPRAPSSP